MGIVGIDIDDVGVVWDNVDIMGCGCRASTRERRRVVGGGLLGLLSPVVRALVLALELDMFAVNKLLEIDAVERGLVVDVVECVFGAPFAVPLMKGASSSRATSPSRGTPIPPATDGRGCGSCRCPNRRRLLLRSS